MPNKTVSRAKAVRFSAPSSLLTLSSPSQVDHAQESIRPLLSLLQSLLARFSHEERHRGVKGGASSRRSVIQLNVIHSIVSIVETIQLEMIGIRFKITLSEVEDDTEKEEPDEGPPIEFSDKHYLSSFISGLTVVSRKTSGVISAAPVWRSYRPPSLQCGRRPLIRTSCLNVDPTGGDPHPLHFLPRPFVSAGQRQEVPEDL